MNAPPRNVDTVARIYQAFGQGDAPTILAAMAPDVQWESWARVPQAPWLLPRQGPEGVGAFLGALAEHLEFLDFRVTEILDGGSVVVGLVTLRARHRGTGKVLTEVDEAHIWRFDAQGRVCRFRHGVDTALHEEACRPG